MRIFKRQKIKPCEEWISESGNVPPWGKKVKEIEPVVFLKYLNKHQSKESQDLLSLAPNCRTEIMNLNFRKEVSEQKSDSGTNYSESEHSFFTGCIQEKD